METFGAIQEGSNCGAIVSSGINVLLLPHKLETQGAKFTTVDKIPFQDYEPISISLSGLQNSHILGASDNISFMLRRLSNHSTILAQTLSITMYTVYRDIPSAQLVLMDSTASAETITTAKVEISVPLGLDLTNGDLVVVELPPLFRILSTNVTIYSHNFSAGTTGHLNGTVNCGCAMKQGKACDLNDPFILSGKIFYIYSTCE